MIQLTPHMRILVAVQPIDFRVGIDGLAAICTQRLQADPFSGALFVFGNRARTAIKILVYDGNGYWLCHKRLSYFPQLPTVQRGQSKVGLGPTGQYSLDDVAHQGEPSLRFVQLRRG